MYIIYYLLNLFPNLGLRLVVGNVPIRYLSSFVVLSFKKVKKADLLLPFIGFFSLMYALLFSWIRPIQGLDFAYAIFFFYAFSFVVVAHNNLTIFRKMVLSFWVLNIVYASVQNVLLNFGVPSSELMMHQNAHSANYIIPPQPYVDGLYRVTGLFVESAPFVVFLMLFHVFLSVLRVRGYYKHANILFIVLAGAKVGYVFLLSLFLNWLNKKARLGLSFVFPIVFFVVIILFFSPIIKELIVYFSESVGGLASILIRIDGLENVIQYLGADVGKLIFGYGYVSSTQLMSGNFSGPNRGIDFFSTYVLSNGILGSFLSILLFCAWYKKSVFIFDKYLKNEFFLVAFLMMLTMGSLQQFQYAFLIVLLSLTGRLNRLYPSIHGITPSAVKI